MADCDAFIAAPSEEALEHCTREQLLKIAEHFSIVVGDKRLKENIKVVLKSELREKGVLAVDEKADSPVSPGVLIQTQGLTFDQQKELLLIQLDHDKCKHELQIKKQIEVERIRQEIEQAKLDLEGHRLSLANNSKGSTEDQSGQLSRAMCSFDINNLRLLPQFNEKDPDTFLYYLIVLLKLEVGLMQIVL